MCRENPNKNLKLRTWNIEDACTVRPFPLNVFLKRNDAADKDDVFYISFPLILVVNAVDAGVKLAEIY